jgi:hypothetical protein
LGLETNGVVIFGAMDFLLQGIASAGTVTNNNTNIANIIQTLHFF